MTPAEGFTSSGFGVADGVAEHPPLDLGPSITRGPPPRYDSFEQRDRNVSEGPSDQHLLTESDAKLRCSYNRHNQTPPAAPLDEHMPNSVGPPERPLLCLVRNFASVDLGDGDTRLVFLYTL
jgi:hypothetical protein